MSVAARPADRVQAPRAALARAGTRAVPLLAALVGASFLLRLVLGWLRETPTFLPTSTSTPSWGGASPKPAVP